LAKLKQTEFYADWGRRNDVVFTIAANLNLNNKAFFYMALSNGERRGSHSAAIAELMALLIPHVRRATHLQMRLLEVGALGSALDALTIPVMFLDSGCRVLEMSRLAEEVLRRRDGLELRRGAVELPANPANASLQREVHEFFKEDGPSGRMFRIPRPSNGEFIAVLLKPGQRQFALSPGKVILMLIDPNGQSKDGLTLASALYRLTPAEGAFVRILVETGSLDATIEIRRISRNTARTQMASIFRKTGTNRQGQLIKLFSTVGRITQMGDDAAEGIALQ
jgi:DNA-binding CsgD family transcriptional regulator